MDELLEDLLLVGVDDAEYELVDDVDELRDDLFARDRAISMSTYNRTCASCRT